MKLHRGFPKTEGATDMMDSAMLAGMLAVFGHSAQVDLAKYQFLLWRIVRCPEPLNEGDWCQNPFNVTLDQLIPIIAGLVAQGKHLEAKMLCKACKERGWLAQNIEADKTGSVKPWWNGPDRIWFAQREFMKNILAGTRNDFWIHEHIDFHSYWTPLKEANQLLAMTALYGPEYTKKWKRKNKQWRECTILYWTAPARNDFELAKFFTERLETV